MLHRLLRDQNQPKDVGVELAMELRFRGRFQGLKLINAGVVDQHIERAEGFLRFREQPLHVPCFGHIALDGDCFAAFAGDVRHHELRACFAGRIVHHHGSAGICQRFGNPRANSLGRACYHGHLAF